MTTETLTTILSISGVIISLAELFLIVRPEKEIKL